METQKTPEKKKLNQVDRFIESIRAEGRFDLHEVIKKSATKALIAIGYKGHNHSKLIEYNLKTKESKILKVNGDVSFNDFVISITPVNEIEVKAEELK